MQVRIWKIWFRFTRKVITFTRKWNVINHSNYSPLANKVFNWALKKNEYAHAMIHDLECKCGVSKVENLLEMRKIFG
jgi:hypothetical protein